MAALDSRNTILELMGELPESIQMELLSSQRFQMALNMLDPDCPIFSADLCSLFEEIALDWLIVAEKAASIPVA